MLSVAYGFLSSGLWRGPRRRRGVAAGIATTYLHSHWTRDTGMGTGHLDATS